MQVLITIIETNPISFSKHFGFTIFDIGPDLEAWPHCWEQDFFFGAVISAPPL